MNFRHKPRKPIGADQTPRALSGRYLTPERFSARTANEGILNGDEPFPFLGFRTRETLPPTVLAHCPQAVGILWQLPLYSL